MKNDNEKKDMLWIVIIVLTAISIIAVDLFFSGEYPLALAKSLFMALAMLVLILIKFNDKPLLKKSLVCFGVFLALALVSWWFPYFNNKLADSNGKVIVKALESYKNEKGKYPASLEDLVPKYIDSLPRAKYTFLWKDFYWVDNNLVYVNDAPVNLMKYDFNSSRWTWTGSETYSRLLLMIKK